MSDFIVSPVKALLLRVRTARSERELDEIEAEAVAAGLSRADGRRVAMAAASKRASLQTTKKKTT